MLSQMTLQRVNFSTQISECVSRGPTLLDFFLSSDTSNCSTMVLSPLGNSDHIIASVSIDSKRDVPFHGSMGGYL